MPIPWYVVALILAVGIVYVVVPVVADFCLRFRGSRLILCPETKAPATVSVDMARAAWSCALGAPTLQLAACSRWPERADCGQTCLWQVEARPEDCLVRNVLSRWYEGRSCVFCKKPFGTIRWLEHKPAVLTPEHKTVEWSSRPAERLYDILGTCLPVCWNCHIVETLRLDHPDMIVDRHRTSTRPN